LGLNASGCIALKANPNILALLFLLAVSAAPVDPAAPVRNTGQSTETVRLTRGVAKVTFSAPVDSERITLYKDRAFVILTINAGHKPSPNSSWYVDAPAEVIVALVAGTMPEVLELERKRHIGFDREMVQEMKRGEAVIWLTRGDDGGPDITMRAFQYVPINGGVLIIDARRTRVRGMPRKQREAINALLASSLDGIKVGGTTVSTAEIQEHVDLK
jgi:hypothetical protein